MVLNLRNLTPPNFYYDDLEFAKLSEHPSNRQITSPKIKYIFNIKTIKSPFTSDIYISIAPAINECKTSLLL